MTHEERRQLFHEARTQPAPLILIVASLVSAAAAIAGLNLWVAAAAGITTLLSGGQVIRTQVLVPVRVKAAQRAAVPVATAGDNAVSLRGTAVQYRPGRWLTAAHLIKGVGPTMKLRLGGAWVEAGVIF